MTRLKFVAFAIVAALIPFALIGGGLLALDLYVHHRAERSAGLNWWGYRGPVVGRKQPGEVRVAMVGGSTTFGYGVTWNEAIPARLEQELRRHTPGHPWSVVNLGYNNEGAHAIVPTLEDFAYLAPDIVVLYEGYNDLAGDEGPNTAVFRHTSPVFRLTGYFPLLPQWIEEKSLLIRYGGDMEAGYRSKLGIAPRTVYRPGLAARTSAAALETVAKVGDALGKQLDKMDPGLPAGTATPATGEAGCSTPWKFYCDAVYRGVQAALANGRKVVVVNQPLLVGDARANHLGQVRALAGMIAARFGGDRRVSYVDLSTAVDLDDTTFAFDRMHLSPEGNAVIAQGLAGPVMRASLEEPAVR